MAAFTTAALIGAGVLAGATATKLATRKKQQGDQPLGPGPTEAAANTAPPAPPILNPADANAQARQAGQRQRKRAAFGGVLTGMKPQTSTTPQARYAKKTLLGA